MNWNLCIRIEKAVANYLVSKSMGATVFLFTDFDPVVLQWATCREESLCTEIPIVWLQVDRTTNKRIFHKADDKISNP